MIKMKGTYSLIIEKSEKNSIKIGALGKKEFEKGYYVYIGSAMNSLIPRIKRHLSDDKKNHWHIDYLLKNKTTNIIDVIFTDNETRIECDLARIISKNRKNIEGFGCSDCNCDSHLIYFNNDYEVLNTVKNAYYELNIPFYDLKYFKTNLE